LRSVVINLQNTEEEEYKAWEEKKKKTPTTSRREKPMLPRGVQKKEKRGGSRTVGKRGRLTKCRKIKRASVKRGNGKKVQFLLKGKQGRGEWTRRTISARRTNQKEGRRKGGYFG